MAMPVEECGLFTPWRDPISGVESFILTPRVAPLQQSFYFTNPSFAAGGRFLWFYVAFPPGGDAYYGRQLAVADLERGTVQHFADTQFMDASPFVDAAEGWVYWTTGLEVWRRSPDIAKAAERVGSFPETLANHRRPLRLATHLTRSVDGARFSIDAQLGDDWFVGDLTLDGSNQFRLWQKFDRCYYHVQFSPTDPELLLIAQDGWHDAGSGAKGDTRDRLWLLRRGQTARPIYPDNPSANRGHEWWDADGQHVWYIDYRHGTERVNIRSGERTIVWPHGHTHSHSDQHSRFLVGDINDPGDAWSVAFFNIASGKETAIVSEMPGLPYPRSRYHVHPHPQFCLDDRYICYTTNVLGEVDVALVPVDRLIAATT
jgi:hypothetical protein